jgi:hypothetical protein
LSANANSNRVESFAGFGHNICPENHFDPMTSNLAARWAFVFALTVAHLAAADVRTAGAIGDGNTDDTAAIQKAVDAGGAVHFPTGTYRLTRTIMVDLEKTGFVVIHGEGAARVLMAGKGPAFQFIGTHAGSAAPSTFKPNVWERQRTPRVTGLEIVGMNPEADGLAANGTMQFTVTDVVIRETRHAIRLHGRNRNVMISDCHIYHNSGIGIFLDAVDQHQTNITGSHISYNAGGGIVVRGGNVRNVHIGNCDIEANMAPNVPPAGNVLLDSTGGSVGEVAITGCTIQHAGGSPGGANIRILGAGQDPAGAANPIRKTNEGHVTISGNVLSDVEINIHLKNARGVTLTGNTFWMGALHDLLVEDSSNVVMGPNNFDRNPRYESARDAARGGLIFRRSRDCTVVGLHVNGVRHAAAAVLVEDCTRFNFSGATILDCDGIGLKLTNTSLSRISGCIIRDDRTAANAAPALHISGGRDNRIVENIFDRAADISAASGTSRNNDVIPRATSNAR